MRKIFLILTLILAGKVFSFEVNVEHENFDLAGANAANGSIIFSSESTKFGLITTSFEGRALKFNVTGKLTANEIHNVEVHVPVMSLKTDSSGRDDKMYEEILNAGKYPEVVVKFPVLKTTYDGSIESQLIILGETYQVPLHVKTELVDGELKVTGNGRFSLKKIKIPDPSIAIAKVRDEFDLTFHLIVK